MAVYMCPGCNEYIDDDYFPGSDVDGELYCEDCSEECHLCEKVVRSGDLEDRDGVGMVCEECTTNPEDNLRVKKQ